MLSLPKQKWVGWSSRNFNSLSAMGKHHDRVKDGLEEVGGTVQEGLAGFGHDVESVLGYVGDHNPVTYGVSQIEKVLLVGGLIIAAIFVFDSEGVTKVVDSAGNQINNAISQVPAIAGSVAPLAPLLL